MGVRRGFLTSLASRFLKHSCGEVLQLFPLCDCSYCLPLFRMTLERENSKATSTPKLLPFTLWPKIANNQCAKFSHKNVRN
ncbi:hypothetical protein POVWA1_006510 [Plasmodium ovale wallikeri]|uniref:Uncharacterized protein n=1 Tax=Plasmodium ovale wallikeri TaxID=864142 RepID=A0A1A8YID8_PLAOA|nr:hypothetical protein POVWA1_006510 [Plasmodium ovale wallikeri]